MPIETERTVAAVLVSHSLYFVAKHSPDSPMGAQWIFPGGTQSPAESPQQALQRHLKTKLNLNATVGERLGLFTGGTSTRPLEVDCYRVDGFTGELELSSYAACAWLAAASLQVTSFASPHDEIVRLLTPATERFA